MADTPSALFVRCSGSGTPFISMDKNFQLVQTFDPDPGETETYACAGSDGSVWLCYDTEAGASVLRNVDPDADPDVDPPIGTVNVEVQIGNAPFTGGFCLHDIGCGRLLTIERSSGQVVAVKVRTIKSSIDPGSLSGSPLEEEDVPDPTLGLIVKRYNLTLDRLDARVNSDGSRMVYVDGTSLVLYDLEGDVAIRTIHNFGVDIGYPCWLSDGSFTVNTNAPSGTWSPPPSGPMVRIKSDGAFLKSYPLPETIESDFLFGVQAMLDAVDCVQKLDDTEDAPGNVAGVGLAWYAYSDDEGVENDHYTVVVIRLETGEVVSQQQIDEFVESSDSWGVFIMLGGGGFGTGTGDLPDQGLPPASNATCGIGTNVSTVSPTPGCNVGGVGFVPTYAGESGVVPTVLDEEDGETLTGKDRIYPEAIITHTHYAANGDETVETLRYAMVDLDDDERKEGRISSFGVSEHGLSDNQGNLKAGTIDLTIMDAEGRPIGSRMEGPTTRYFARDEMKLQARSRFGREHNLRPRAIARAILDGESYSASVDRSVESQLLGSDPLFEKGGPFSPDKKVPQWTWPVSFFGNAPPDVGAIPMAIILGEGAATSDEGAINPETGLSNSRGKLPWRFLGMDGLGTGPGGTGEVWGVGGCCLFAIDLIINVYASDCGGLGVFGRNATASVDTNKKTGKVTTTITLDGTQDLSVVPGNGLSQIVFYTVQGKSSARIISKGFNSVRIDSQVDPDVVNGSSWYIARNDYVPRRVRIDLATRNGPDGDCMVPKYPGYVRENPYEDFLGPEGDYRATLMWFRGPLLAAHLAGEVTIGFNARGVEESGVGTGRVLNEYFTVENWFLDNCVHRQLQRPNTPVGGELKWPQTDGDLPQFVDGVHKTKQSDFAKCQAISKRQIGGNGLQIGAYFGEGTSIRDILQLFNDNSGSRLYINEHGQVGVWMFDATDDPSQWPRIDHVSRAFGDIRRWRAHDEVQNVMRGGHGWDFESGTFKDELEPIVSASGVQHQKGLKQYSKHFDGKLVATREQFISVLKRELAWTKDGRVYVQVRNCDHGLLDFKLGQGILFTSLMGPGALGWKDHPLVILNMIYHVDDDVLDVLFQEVGEDLAQEETGPVSHSYQRFRVTNDTSVAPKVSNDPAIAPDVRAA